MKWRGAEELCRIEDKREMLSIGYSYVHGKRKELYGGICPNDLADDQVPVRSVEFDVRARN